MTPQQQSAWDGWVAGRPPVVQALCNRFLPWALYRNKVTGQIGRVLSYAEDGTLRMLFEPTDTMPVEVEVFGVQPEHLEDAPSVSYWLKNDRNA